MKTDARETDSPAPAIDIGQQSRADAEVRPLTWRIIRDQPRRAANNMALDHALAACLADDHAVLRLYSWTRPTASFGRNEPTAGLYSAEAANAQGIDYIRRPTGGRAVLHHGELTYAVIAPPRALGGVRNAYRLINQALASALQSLGAQVTVADGHQTLDLDAGPCFQAPADGEVMANGRKLIGSAQARVEGALLQHGSIILTGDQTRLDLLRKPEPRAESPDHSTTDRTHQPATLFDQIGPVTPQQVGDAVADHMKKVFGGRWSEGEYSERELLVADRLVDERYGRDEWTWRR